MGMIFDDSKSKLYLVGDTIYNDEVKATIQASNPNAIVLNSCDAKLDDGESIIMSKEDTLKVCLDAPNATIIASHMGVINHLSLSRDELRDYAKKHNFDITIPQDGESLDVA
ncbi:MAG: hypothetical protein MR902_00545 [Campylobacter sp.]|nr:hypothetical protein [Campylobacter sp.]